MHELTLTQIVFTEYAAIFSYLMMGALLSAIFNLYTKGNLNVITQIHITLLWPWHLVTFVWTVFDQILALIFGFEDKEE